VCQGFGFFLEGSMENTKEKAGLERDTEMNLQGEGGGVQARKKKTTKRGTE